MKTVAADTELPIQEAAALLRQQVGVTQVRVAMKQRLRQSRLVQLQRLHSGKQFRACRAQPLYELPLERDIVYLVLDIGRCESRRQCMSFSPSSSRWHGSKKQRTFHQ